MTAMLFDGAIRVESERLAKVSEEDLRKFATFFEEIVWKRIPATFQADMIDYWRNKTVPNTDKVFDPHITIYNNKYPDYETPNAFVHLSGHVLQFPFHFLFECLSSDLAILVVAHELAHVSYFVESEENHLRRNDDPKFYNQAEGLVDERLEGWGFSPDATKELYTILAPYGSRYR